MELFITVYLICQNDLRWFFGATIGNDLLWNATDNSSEFCIKQFVFRKLNISNLHALSTRNI